MPSPWSQQPFDCPLPDSKVHKWTLALFLIQWKRLVLPSHARTYIFRPLGERIALTEVGAGLLVHSFLSVEAVDPGFEPEHVLTMNITAPWGTPEQRLRGLYQSTLERVSVLPGVQAVGGINGLFDLGPQSVLGLRAIEGR